MNSDFKNLNAISPLDGRYQRLTEPLSAYFSEDALIRHRVQIEIRWLITLSMQPSLPEPRILNEDEIGRLLSVAANMTGDDVVHIKTIERTTNHDVKAVEYFVREKLAALGLDYLAAWTHFACTSEDINNLAYALMLKKGIEQVYLPLAKELVETVAVFAHKNADQPMLAHTHGQPATPTTLGKEMAVFVYRWRRQLRQIVEQEYLGKINGAVGGFNAHIAAFPNAPWQEIAERFVVGLGLTYNPLTTQIEPHDFIAELSHSLIRFHTITIDFVRDIWTYISIGYIKQRIVAGETGSSTMPHKVNPIDFENAEANLGVANALLEHLATKLPISRLQRDLSDSSAIRNIGSAIAYGYIALQSTRRGLGKIDANIAAMEADLDANWEVLGEAIQTVLRKHGQTDAYERLKDLTRGASVNGETLRAFIATLDLPDTEKARLADMSPRDYVGNAPELARLV